jgi:N-acetylmuramoyl-L-alanine amidase
MTKVYVSPSDQVGNTYAYGNTNEAVQCRKIAQALVDALKRNGFEAKTNFKDGGQAMYDRVKESNAWGADLHLCIHTNAFDGKVTGTRCFYYNMGESYKATKAVFDSLAPITPGKSENMKPKPEFYEMHRTIAPAVYVEAEFHDNPGSAKWIVEHTDDIAEAICKGVCAYFKADYKEKESTLYRVQCGAFSVKKNAEAYMEKLKADGYDAFIVEVNV